MGRLFKGEFYLSFLKLLLRLTAQSIPSSLNRICHSKSKGFEKFLSVIALKHRQIHSTCYYFVIPCYSLYNLLISLLIAYLGGGTFYRCANWLVFKAFNPQRNQPSAHRNASIKHNHWLIAVYCSFVVHHYTVKQYTLSSSRRASLQSFPRKAR